MKRRRKSDRERPEHSRATRITALVGAAVIFLARRRCNPRGTAVKEATPTPAPPERTWLEEKVHCLTWPVRKKDQVKKREEERQPKTPEPPTDTGKTVRLCGVTLTCGDPGAKADDAEKPEKKDDEPSGLSGIVLKVLGAIATGIGVVGAVTVVGAAVFWVRFDAIDLPATQAVSVIPKAELLVQGAQEVILFIAIGLAAALLIALADPKGIVTRGTVIVLCAFVLIATAYVLLKSLPIVPTLGLVGLALILALLCVGIAFATGQRLLPLLVSVFLAALIFSSSCALLIVNDQKYAQAIAIRFGADEQGVGKGLTGIYVTVTSDTIYFAQIGNYPESKESVSMTGLYEVHRADTTTYAVGPLAPTTGPEGSHPVEEQAEDLLKRLNKDGKAS